MAAGSMPTTILSLCATILLLDTLQSSTNFQNDLHSEVHNGWLMDVGATFNTLPVQSSGVLLVVFGHVWKLLVHFWVTFLSHLPAHLLPCTRNTTLPLFNKGSYRESMANTTRLESSSYRVKIPNLGFNWITSHSLHPVSLIPVVSGPMVVSTPAVN